MPITLTFYDEVKPGDAQFVVDRLNAQPADPVEVRINSPGGAVHEALAIFNALKPRRPTVHIDGLAASAASVIAMAGGRIIAAENALVMIHDPWTTATGNSSDMRRTADTLDIHRDALLVTYGRTGIDRPTLLRMLADETWMSAQDALRLGFVDAIAESLAYARHSAACFASYQRTPKELLEMPKPTEPTAPTAPSSPHDVRAAFLSEQRHRNDQIVMLAKSRPDNHDVQDLARAALADPEMSFEEYGQRYMAIVARGVEPLGFGMINEAGNAGASAGPGAFRSSGHGADFVTAASDMLVMRAGIRIEKPHAGVRDVQGMALSDIMRASISRAGRREDFAGNSRSALVKAALSTPDFPAVLENTLGKALRAGYEAEPATFEAWTRRVLVPDFKEQSRVLLGSAPALLPVSEGGEYTLGSMDEDKSVPYSVGKYGRLVQLTWEALVNDDLGAFLRVTQAMGQAASRAEGDTVYGTFAENAWAGQTMQDGLPLFDAAHRNLTASFAGVTADALAAARVLLRRQVAVGGGALNLPPRYLLVAPEHEQAAEILLAAAARSMSQGESNTLIPAWLAQLQLVVEARLQDDSFYLLTSADAVDTLERAWLEDDNGPRITEEDGFKTDARTYKVRHVFGGRWLDWRGAVKIPLS